MEQQTKRFVLTFGILSLVAIIYAAGMLVTIKMAQQHVASQLNDAASSQVDSADCSVQDAGIQDSSASD